MQTDIQSLAPKPLWNLFHVLTQYPRPSRHEEAVLCAIEARCNEHHLKHFRDEIGNLIIRKPATKGFEDLKGVVMQGHIDMVPQKNADSAHDFLKDPIQTHVIETESGRWVTAKDTTLGADNGIGVAAALAVMFADDIEHGPLEVLITIDEESGMTGAKGLTSDSLQGEVLLNLDTEDEGELYVGCAGGVDVTATLTVAQEKLNEPEHHDAFELSITGLRGGHSGLDIHTGRGNACKLLNRFLLEYAQSLSIRVASIQGGTLRNAIPREAFCTFAIPKTNRASLNQAVERFSHSIMEELQSVEENLSINLTAATAPENVYATQDFDHVIKAVAACYHGAIRMSPDFEGVVESSNNLAVVQSNEDRITILCLARSLSDSARDDIARSLSATFQLAGATTDISGEYPGWKPDPQSHMLQVLSDVYQKQYGHIPKVKVIHAGLECGLLSKPYPNWDMISFGPTIRHAHSPDERVHIASVEKFWDFLLAILVAIPKRYEPA